MGCKTITEKLGGHEVSVMQLSATEATALESRLAPVILQGIVPIVSSIGKSDDVQAAAISSGMSGMMSSMPPAEMAALMVELCEQVNIDGKRVEYEIIDPAFWVSIAAMKPFQRNAIIDVGLQFDRDLGGADGVLLKYQLAWFVLRANFSGFFKALLPEGVGERAAKQFGKSLGMESTGESGG